MEILGYVLASLIGISLGLIGSGGSILTVPLLVYVFNVTPVLATAYSLFIVGITSLLGSARNVVHKEIKLKNVIIFGLPSIIAVYITRTFIVPQLPETLFRLNGFLVQRDGFIMVLFALFMMLASAFMIRSRNRTSNEQKVMNVPYGLIFLEGALVGTLTGFVGAGGGFMIIPVLVIALRLPMKEAVATSLAIIAMKSMIGFLGDVQNFSQQINWTFLLTLTGISVVGIFVGIYLTRFLSSKFLKKSFGWFVFVMSIFVLLKEFL